MMMDRLPLVQALTSGRDGANRRRKRRYRHRRGDRGHRRHQERPGALEVSRHRGRIARELSRLEGLIGSESGSQRGEIPSAGTSRCQAMETRLTLRLGGILVASMGALLAISALHRACRRDRAPARHHRRVLAAAEAAADVAGAVIRPFFRAGLAIEDKYDASPVTLADRTAEHGDAGRPGRPLPRARHPRRGIRPGTPRRARCAGCSTRSTAPAPSSPGGPQFGTLIGLLDDGVPVLGIIDQPVTGERWIGVAGRPTTLPRPVRRRGGRAALRRRWPRAELSCTSPEMFAPGQWAAWQRLAGSVARASFGGDCYAYGLLALGHIDVIAEADLKVWDWAAMVPVIEGAGGRMTDWRGRSLRGDPAGASQAGPVIAVGDPGLLEPALALLAAAAA